MLDFFKRLWSYKFYPTKLYYYSPKTEQLCVLVKVPNEFFFDNNHQPVCYRMPNLEVIAVQKNNNGDYKVVSQKFATTLYSSAEDAVEL